MGDVGFKETICRECLKRFPDARVLVRKGTLRLVDPPCDFCQRAIDDEEPNHGERANIVEKPMRGERAKVREKPKKSERAVTEEKPKEGERAMRSETPV